MNNEEILRIFLKKHRKLTSFRNNRKNNISTLSSYTSTSVTNALRIGFYWDQSPEGHIYWFGLHKKWCKLCKDFNIEGEINFKKV